MKLLPITPELITSAAVKSSGFLTDICTATIALYPQSGPELPWVGYVAEECGNFIGACAFKSLPIDDTVEIAYVTFPGYETRGIATRMAKQLLDIAAIHAVKTVKAQTLPEHNASTHILQKLQFVFAGVVQHPEDGEVWEWIYSTTAK